MLCFFICIATTLYAQFSDAKRDNVWMLGYDGFDVPTSTKYGAMQMDFLDKKQPVVSPITCYELSFNLTNANICDTLGNLLFYTDGYRIFNKNHKIIPNASILGKSLHNGQMWPKRNPIVKGALILPIPNSINTYIVLHQHLEELPILGAHSFALFQTKLEVDSIYQECSIKEKNTVILQDTLAEGIVATRHANGRDWWIIIQKEGSNLYYILLLDPKGLHLIQQQYGWKGAKRGLRQCTFSPDGTRFATYNLTYHNDTHPIDVFNFDRCSGKLTQTNRIDHRDTLTFGHALAFSPNSRFLYACSSIYAYQYDMEAPDIKSSCDSLLLPDSTAYQFFAAQNAPDGKIYMASIACLKKLSVINHPNLKGKACDIQRQSVQLLRHHCQNLPNFPNYRLGALVGSPCDSLLHPSPKPSAVLYPNPLLGQELKLRLSAAPSFGQGTLELYNALGQRVFSKPFYQGGGVEYSFSVQDLDLASGVYFYSIVLDGEVVYGGKLMVVQ